VNNSRPKKDTPRNAAKWYFWNYVEKKVSREWLIGMHAGYVSPDGTRIEVRRGNIEIFGVIGTSEEIRWLADKPLAKFKITDILDEIENELHSPIKQLSLWDKVSA
jgi:hypothetical protein